MNFSKLINSSFILNEKINIYGIFKIIIIEYNKKIIIEIIKRFVFDDLSENLVNSNINSLIIIIKNNLILAIEFIIWQKYMMHLGNFDQIMNSID